MASIRIHEDQENVRVAENRRPGKDLIQQHKRSVLGAIDNKQLNIQNRVKQQYNPLKDNDKHIFPPKLSTTIHVPVAQFEAFNVYEDKTNINIIETKKEPKETIKQKKEEHVLEEATCRLPAKNVEPLNQVSLPDTTIVSECPMSVDKSVRKIAIENTVKRRDEILYDLLEYRDDIYRYMRESEFKHRPKAGYMKKQPDINASMRTILVDWLVEVGEEYKLQTETLFFAVSYIDRFLSFMSVVRAKLQLVGTAAMFIAAKYEEIYPPDVSEFVYITDDTYNKKQVLRMEHLILKVLSFDLSAPTTLSFLKHFCITQNLDEKIMYLAMYLSELSLLEADPYLQYLPSHLASSAIALARYTSNEDPWPVEYEQASGYRLDYLKPCIKHLHEMFTNALTLSQKAIQEKYKTASHLHVSMILPKEFSPDFFKSVESNVASTTSI